MKMTMSAIMTLAMPAIIEQVMVTMVQYVDTAMVGSLGSVATAAVGLTSSTNWLINGFLSASSIGFSVQVAQYVGAQESEKARDVVGQALRFVILFGLLMGAIAFGISFPLPYLLGAEAEVAPLASSYYRIVACAVPFQLGSLMFGAILRCAGDTRTPMIFNLSINMINMLLNFLFIYPTRSLTVWGITFTMPGAGMGVEGAAWGTWGALFTVCVLYLIVIFRRTSPIQQKWGQWCAFSRPVLKTAWKLGLPVAMERSLISVAQIIITGVITGIGTVAVAANHLAVTAESLSYMPAYGIAAAATTMIGQAMGAKRLDLAKKFSRLITGMGIGIMVCGGIALYIFAPYLIRIFSNEAPVIELGTQVLRIVAFSQPFFAMAIVVTGVLRGAGDTKAPFLISLVTMWGVRITLSLILSQSMGLTGVWLAMSIELGVRGILFMIRMCRDKWLKIKLV